MIHSEQLGRRPKDFRESSSSLMFAFMLALILIYLVLSAQFESFKDPLIVMMTVPLALTGALLFMWYFNITMNIFSQIGIIMLIGLVSKNGILIVEFANQRKQTGMSRLEAIKLLQPRLRPADDQFFNIRIAPWLGFEKVPKAVLQWVWQY
jgi:multidrug efflux pump